MSTTSGVTSFRLLTSELVNEAFALLQMSIEGASISSEMYNEGERTLNILMAKFQDMGLHLWSYTEGILFLEGGKYVYIPEQNKATNEYYQTYLTADATSPTTSFTVNTELDTYNVATPEDPAVDWFVGIMKNDNELFWSTVVTYDAGTGALEIADAIDGDADENCTVFFYKTQIQELDRVLEIRRTDNLLNDSPLDFTSRDEYFRLPTKTSQGIPAQSYYSRELPYGKLYLWPTPTDSQTLIRFTYERKLQDFVDVDDCPDIPKYWIEALTAQCARRLGIKYRVPPAIMAEVKELAETALNEALAYDNEQHDISFSVNRRN